jgi:hypothetical protein
MAHFNILAQPNTGDYYEGNRNFLRPIYPRPTVSPVSFVNQTLKKEIVFREDSYDPTTRIRRGRFYERSFSPAQISSGLVHYFPYPKPVEILGSQGDPIFKFQDTYEHSNDLISILLSLKDYDLLLGTAPTETRWKIIDAESLSDGTTLFTLKALSSFGLLPTLNTDNEKVISSSDKVLAAALSYPPVSVVDVCREAARVILTEKFEPALTHGKDLGEIAQQLEKADPAGNLTISSASKIISRLHSRGKSAEHEKRAQKGKQIRSVMDNDAILAVNLFGLLL